LSYNSKYKDTEIGYMPTSWQVKKLSEVTLHIVDCSHAKKPPFIKTGNNVFLEVSNIDKNGNLDLNTIKYVSNDDYKAWTKRLVPKANDVIITKTGRVGAVAIIPSCNLNFCIGRNQVIIRSNEKIVLSDYLLYYMLSNIFISEN